MAKTLEELDKETSDTVNVANFWCLDTDSFDDLVNKLNASFPDSVDGRSMLISDVGEPYREFIASSLCRPDTFDMKTTEKYVATQMANLLTAYFSRNPGRIYWRIHPEAEWYDLARVIMYDENGPDVDIWTDRKCFLDKRWKRYVIYARLIRSDKPSLVAVHANG